MVWVAQTRLATMPQPIAGALDISLSISGDEHIAFGLSFLLPHHKCCRANGCKRCRAKGSCTEQIILGFSLDMQKQRDALPLQDKLQSFPLAPGKSRGQQCSHPTPASHLGASGAAVALTCMALPDAAALMPTESHSHQTLT